MIQRRVADLWRLTREDVPDTVNWADLYKRLLADLAVFAAEKGLAEGELRTRILELMKACQHAKPPSRASLVRERLAQQAVNCCTSLGKNTGMTLEIPKEARKEAIASIERYFKENMEEPIGNIAAGALLGFVLAEIGPLVYNQAVADVQERLQARVAELDLEIHEDEFQYWRKLDTQRKGK
ncbi:MAG: hypothetical protein RLZZ401_1787 [Pseudomonadota bacterium]|jgi:uncharacterized protein (DUF2164 family)